MQGRAGDDHEDDEYKTFSEQIFMPFCFTLSIFGGKFYMKNVLEHVLRRTKKCSTEDILKRLGCHMYHHQV